MSSEYNGGKKRSKRPRLNPILPLSSSLNKIRTNRKRKLEERYIKPPKKPKILSSNWTVFVSDDIYLLIFSLLDYVSILSCSEVCKTWENVVNNKANFLWYTLYSEHDDYCCNPSVGSLYSSHYNNNSVESKEDSTCTNLVKNIAADLICHPFINHEVDYKKIYYNDWFGNKNLSLHSPRFLMAINGEISRGCFFKGLPFEASQNWKLAFLYDLKKYQKLMASLPAVDSGCDCTTCTYHTPLEMHSGIHRLMRRGGILRANEKSCEIILQILIDFIHSILGSILEDKKSQKYQKRIKNEDPDDEIFWRDCELNTLNYSPNSVEITMVDVLDALKCMSVGVDKRFLVQQLYDFPYEVVHLKEKSTSGEEGDDKPTLDNNNNNDSNIDTNNRDINIDNNTNDNYNICNNINSNTINNNDNITVHTNNDINSTNNNNNSTNNNINDNNTTCITENQQNEFQSPLEILLREKSYSINSQYNNDISNIRSMFGDSPSESISFWSHRSNQTYPIGLDKLSDYYERHKRKRRFRQENEDENNGEDENDSEYESEYDRESMSFPTSPSYVNSNDEPELVRLYDLQDNFYFGRQEENEEEVKEEEGKTKLYEMVQKLRKESELVTKEYFTKLAEEELRNDITPTEFKASLLIKSFNDLPFPKRKKNSGDDEDGINVEDGECEVLFEDMEDDICTSHPD